MKNLISSVELIKKAGISRATLNNYIKLGLIAKPIIKKPLEERSKAKRIGYFDHATLGRILQILTLKKQGYSMSQVADFLIGEGHQTNDKQMHLQFHDERKLESLQNGKTIQSFSLKEIDKEKAIDEKQIFSGSMKFHCFSVLVAKLKDAIRAELPSREYNLLYEGLRDNANTILEECDGVMGNCSEDRVILFFIKRDDKATYVFKSLYAALELKKKMLEYGNTLKEKGKLNSEIHLGIGIVEGHGLLKKIWNGIRDSVIDFGTTVSNAEALADFSSCGSIWTTKSTLEMLDDPEYRKIKYGITTMQTNNSKVENITYNRYTRLIDRVDISNPDNKKYLSIAVLPIAEIYQITK